MGFLEWFATTFAGDEVAEARSRELEAEEARRAGLVREREAYFGTSTPVVDEATGAEIDPATGRPFAETVGGTESHDTGGWGWSWLSETWRSVTGETTTTSGVDEETGEAVRHVDEDRRSVGVGVDGRVRGESTERDVVERLDVAGMAGTAKRELERQLREEGEAMTADERARVERDIAALGATPDEATLTRIIEEHRLRIRPQHVTVAGTESSTSGSFGVDGVGLSGEGTHTDTTHLGEGASRTETTRVSGEVDVMGGSAELSGRRTSSETRDGVTESGEVHGSARVAAGDGALTLSGTRGASASRVRGEGDDAVTELGMQQEDTSSVSVVGGERGHGLGMGSSSTRGVTVDGVTATQTDSSSAAVTDRGVFGEAATERSLGGRHGSVTSRSSVDGSFTVDVEPIAGSAPAQYRVVMTLSAGAGLRLGGEAHSGPESATDRAAGSAHVGVRGSVEMTYRHVMDEAEVAQYMDQVDQADAGAEPGGEPEFGLISRLRALAGEGDQAAIGGAAVLGSSEAGATLGDGESIELTLTGAVDVGGSAGGTRGGFGGSVSASRTDSWTRTVRVERVAAHEAGPAHLVDVTVSFVDADRWQAGGSATVEAVTAGYEHTSAESETESVVVRLDVGAPDYADRYATVCAAMDPATLRSLAHEYTTATSESSGDQITMGGGGAALEIGSTSSGSESVTLGADGSAEATFSGGVTDRGAISVGGTDVLQSSERNTATVTVDEAGTEATLETERASSDVWRSISEGASSAWDAIAGVFDGEGNAVTETADIVTESPQARLQEQLETTYSDLEQYSLSEGDIDTLVTRAGDRSSWDSCCTDLDTYPVWQGLRGTLRSPTIDPRWAEVDAAQAARLARGRAIAGFMRETGSDGMECMVNVLRYYGQRGGYTSARDLGTHLEWPESLGTARTRFNTAHGRIRRADQELAPFIGRPDGMTRAQAWYDDTSTKLREAEEAIRASTDITDRSARMEMIEACLRERHALEEAFERNRGALETGVAQSVVTPEAAIEGPACEVGGHDEEMSVAPPMSPEAQAAQRRIGEAVGLLAGYKAEERAAFAEARGMMTEEYGGTLTGFFSAFSADYREANAVVGYRLSQLIENWITKVRELRGLYEAAGTPADQWVVSRGPGEPRNASYEPDVETRCRILTSINTASSMIDFAWRDHLAAYRSQADY